MATAVGSDSGRSKVLTLVVKGQYRGMPYPRYFVKEGAGPEDLTLDFPIENAMSLESKGYSGDIKTRDGEALRFEPGKPMELQFQTITALHFDEGAAQ